MPRPFPAGHVFPMATLAAFQVQLTVISRAFSKRFKRIRACSNYFYECEWVHRRDGWECASAHCERPVSAETAHGS